MSSETETALDEIVTRTVPYFHIFTDLDLISKPRRQLIMGLRRGEADADKQPKVCIKHCRLFLMHHLIPVILFLPLLLVNRIIINNTSSQ